MSNTDGNKPGESAGVRSATANKKHSVRPRPVSLEVPVPAPVSPWPTAPAGVHAQKLSPGDVAHAAFKTDPPPLPPIPRPSGRHVVTHAAATPRPLACDYQDARARGNVCSRLLAAASACLLIWRRLVLVLFLAVARFFSLSLTTRLVLDVFRFTLIYMCWYGLGWNLVQISL